MKKLTTADCQNFLASNKEIQDLIETTRYDFSEIDEGSDEEDSTGYTDYLIRVNKDRRNPKKWVRTRKYKVGSTTDTELGLNLASYEELKKDKQYFSYEIFSKIPDLTGGIVREFWLRDTDHITILLVEKDGEIVYFEDLSD